MSRGFNQASLRPARWTNYLFLALLLALLVTGVAFRFLWVDWSQGANLHPDEYGLTGTLTQLHLPATFSEYFNTRLSPISPYQKYDLAGNPAEPGPDNRMRWGQWPIILIRWFAEISAHTGYDALRLAGRRLSALADTLSLLLVYLGARKLYPRRVALLGATLSALAVMQIQQSHFMTVDNFALLFTSAALYAAIRVATVPNLHRKSVPAGADRPGNQAYRMDARVALWYLLFGIAFGMAVASRINLLPLGGMLLVAAFIGTAGLTLRNQADLTRIACGVWLYLIIAALAAAITFRVTQPMSFRNPTGDTTFLDFYPNPDWVESMKISMSESRGIGGGPPAEQWANRAVVFFPWMNLVVWGMGLPLGLTAWLGFLWAAWRVFRHGQDWQAHLLPLVWVGGFFGFMGTRWACSMRYLLPIYPFLSLLAAWLLYELWPGAKSTLSGGRQNLKKTPGLIRQGIAALATGAVLLGTFFWAVAFVQAVYLSRHTRLQASQWIMENIPAPIELEMETSESIRQIKIPAPDLLRVAPDAPFSESFTVPVDGVLRSIRIARAAGSGENPTGTRLNILVALDPEGRYPVEQANIAIGPAKNSAAGDTYTAQFPQAVLSKNSLYYLVLTATGAGEVNITRLAIANESWDEGLPIPSAGYDPYGQFYRGVTMEVRWYDDENKRQMFLDTLAQADYLILPSQRSIWSTSRIPLTYPMTMAYYRALFDGRLGFDLAAQFTSPLRLGPLLISDVGGTIAWDQAPPLPLFNDNALAAEEAFSVYDHPPVWIFKKRADFSLEQASAILCAIDLSKVIIQSPGNATRVSEP